MRCLGVASSQSPSYGVYVFITYLVLYSKHYITLKEFQHVLHMCDEHAVMQAMHMSMMACVCVCVYVSGRLHTRGHIALSAPPACDAFQHQAD